MDSAADTVLSRQGDTVSSIAYEVYGSSRGQVERILALNPALCRQPAELPAGIVIKLPRPESRVKTVETLNLWD